MLNHRSDWDIVGIFHRPFSVVVSPYWKKFKGIVAWLGVTMNVIYAREQAGDVNVSSSVRDSVIHAIQSHLDQNASHPIPLLVFPEGATTNGKGILQFNKTIFSIASEILPLAISISFPIPLPIHIDYLFDSWLSNAFWILFSPATVFRYQFLPRQVTSNFPSFFF